MTTVNLILIILGIVDPILAKTGTIPSKFQRLIAGILNAITPVKDSRWAWELAQSGLSGRIGNARPADCSTDQCQRKCDGDQWHGVERVMKKVLILLVLVISAVGAQAQASTFAPAGVASMCYSAALSKWVPVAALASGTAATYAPQSVALYGLNGSSYYPLQCDASGNLNLPVVATLDLTAQAANVAQQTLYTPTVTGTYEVNFYEVITLAGVTSSTLPSGALQWTDPDTSVTTPPSIQEMCLAGQTWVSARTRASSAPRPEQPS